jgi:hypothetical protein
MTSRRFFAPWVLLSTLTASCLAACGSDSDSSTQNGGFSGGQTGEEGVGCQPVQRDPIAWSERSPLGFSADDILAAIGSTRETRLEWEDGTSTALTVGIERASSGQVEFQEREWVASTNGSGIEPAVGVPECNDVVAIPVTLTFTTNDGAFADEWDLTLLAETTSGVTAFLRFDPSELEGSYTVSEVDPAAFDDIQAFIELDLSEDGWTGTVSGEASQTNANGTASARMFEIASF